MINKILNDTKNRMEKCVSTFKNHISKIHTGRASPSIISELHIEYYGISTPLHQLANIVAENSHTLVITVFDRAIVPLIKKSIIASDLGLNPLVSNTVIRVLFPPLTEERRRDLAKVVRSKAEHSRVLIRNIRRDANDQVKALLKNKAINEDEDHRSQEKIQELTDTWIKVLDSTLAEKEGELMKI